MERSLSQDLRLAAVKRLQNATAATETLMGLELESIQQKYSNFANEPRFRAIVEAQDGPTMDFYAQELFVNTLAIAVAFTDLEGKILASAGDFVGLENMETGHDQTVLSLVDDVLITSSQVSLQGRRGLLGYFITQQVGSQNTIDEWARLLGVQLVIGGAAMPKDHLEAVPASLPMIQVFLSNEAAANAIRQARFMALYSLIIAMIASISLGYLLARRFTVGPEVLFFGGQKVTVVNPLRLSDDRRSIPSIRG